MHRDLIVMGASAGGIEALQRVLRGLPADLQAAVLVVQHTSSRSNSHLAQILERGAYLPVTHPQDWTRIEPGRVYVAPPDHHLLVQGDQLRVLQGPKENRHRPAIDPLFRSAAVHRGARVIGVVLSGLMDDGTAGLLVVRAHRGAAVIQDPETALYGAMPTHALKAVPDATVLPLELISEELVRLVGEELPDERLGSGQCATGRTDPDSLEAKETRFLENEAPQIANDERPGEPSSFACPDCGGVLWELEEHGFLRFRCRVGHAFTARHLGAEQRNAIETALWSALRALEERASLYQRMAQGALPDRQGSATRFQDQANLTEENAQVLREFLVDVLEGAAD
ncbi:MAG: chemotaxis protein CheB [Acidobacteriaceae bacterium]